MSVHSIDRCQVCHTTVDLDWSAYVCEHGVVVCEGCESYLACEDCDADRWAEDTRDAERRADAQRGACEPGLADAILLAHYRKGPIQ